MPSILRSQTFEQTLGLYARALSLTQQLLAEPPTGCLHEIRPRPEQDIVCAKASRELTQYLSNAGGLVRTVHISTCQRDIAANRKDGSEPVKGSRQAEIPIIDNMHRTPINMPICLDIASHRVRPGPYWHSAYTYTGNTITPSLTLPRSLHQGTKQSEKNNGFQL